MNKELINSFGKVYLIIENDAENRLIYVNWKGYLTEENIKNGAQAYVQALSDAGYHAVLNDTRHIVGSWTHSMDWIINEWAPSAARAGLKRIAMLASPESFAESSASTFISELKAFEAKAFDDLSEARQWLSQVN